MTTTRCVKCSKLNHRTQDCRGEITCPLCAGPHIQKECKGDPTTIKCTNCENYKRHDNTTNKISVHHSTLDRKCPSVHAVLEKNRKNTAYLMDRLTKNPDKRRNKISSMNMTMGCLQINLRQSKTATYNLQKIIDEEGTDILVVCIQELYSILSKVMGIPRAYSVFASGAGRKGQLY